MDEFPRMLYRMPGRDVQADAGWCATCIVHDDEAMATAVADGWASTPDGAAAALRKAAEPEQPIADDAPPTREELERKAAELGIKVDGRWGDRKIADAIDEVIKA